MSRPDARPALLDTAERLFAQEGIATVSDRRLAEAAGNSNHSAVRYYFGGREGLLRALLDRHLTGVERKRELAFAQSDSLLGDVRALVGPTMEAYAALPVPSWRARFMDLAQHDPLTAEMLRDSGDQAPVAARIYESILARLEHLPPEVVQARAGMMTYLVGGTCAEIERRSELDPARGDPSVAESWRRGSEILCDAITGLLQAPATSAPA